MRQPWGAWHAIAILIFALPLFCVGCGGEESPLAPASPPDIEPVIETDLTDPVAVIATHARALTEKNYAAYAALIDLEFEFYSTYSAVPWLRTEELRMIERLLNENYIETYQDVVVLEGAETMRFEATVLDVRPIEDGVVEVNCACRGYAITGPDDMFVFRSRLLFTLVQREGFLRIRKVVESEEPGVRLWKFWGTVKAYYN